MSLDIYLMETSPHSVFALNITHNLTDMAKEAGIYKHLWRPEASGIKKARQLIKPLSEALGLLESDPERFKKFNPDNGWGDYDGLVAFVRAYIDACIRFPKANIRISR